MVIIYLLLLFPNQLLGSSHIQVSFPLWFENIELFALMLKHHIEIFWLFLLCWLYDQKYLTQSLTLNVSDCVCLIFLTVFLIVKVSVKVSGCFCHAEGILWKLSYWKYLIESFRLFVLHWKYRNESILMFVLC